jgi:hypothetical protein
MPSAPLPPQAEAEDSERRAFRQEAGSLWRITFGPLVWAAHFVLSYGSAAVVCARFAPAGIAPMRLGLAAASLLALALILWLGWRSWQQWRGPWRGPGPDFAPETGPLTDAAPDAPPDAPPDTGHDTLPEHDRTDTPRDRARRRRSAAAGQAEAQPADPPGIWAQAEDRHRFLGHAAFLLAVVSFIGVSYSSLPVLLLESCR